MILWKAAIYISLSMLLNNSAFICLPLASVCSIYLFISGDFLLTGTQPCWGQMWGEGVGSGGLCPVVLFPASCSAAVFTLRLQGFTLRGVPGAHPCTGQVTGGKATPVSSCSLPPCLQPPPRGMPVGAAFECEVLLWDTKIW